MSEVPFERWDIVEVASNRYRKDYKVESGTPGRVRSISGDIDGFSSVEFSEGKVISVPNRLLRRPLSYRQPEYIVKAKNSKTFAMLMPKVGFKSRKHNKKGLRRAYGAIITKDITK